MCRVANTWGTGVRFAGSMLHITNSTFQDNAAQHGGAIVLEVLAAGNATQNHLPSSVPATAVFANSSFQGNSAVGQGGAVWVGAHVEASIQGAQQLGSGMGGPPAPPSPSPVAHSARSANTRQRAGQGACGTSLALSLVCALDVHALRR